MRPGHGDSGRRQEEQFIHVLQNGDVGIKMDQPFVFRLAEREQFGDALIPRLAGA